MKNPIYRKRLALEDLSGYTDQQIRDHWIASWEIAKVVADAFNPVAAYESVGDFGCDSSGWFLLQNRETGELFEVHGSHCSCYGFEDQFTPEPTTLEYLKSDKFGLFCGGYDDHKNENKTAVVDFLKNL